MLRPRSDVLAARSGDRVAFDRLILAHTSTVCALTTAILGSPAAGEEVGQEVFVAAWKGLRTLQDPDRFGAWLRGIARNRAREALRVRARRREVAEDALGELADPAADPAERLDERHREAALWSALDGLDEDHREVLVLFYREGSSVGEVARHLDLAEPAVRKRLSRARERLREDLEARLGERIARTAPRAAAFVAAVGAAIAASPAQAAGAATGTAALKAVGAALTAAAVGLMLVTGVLGARIRRDLPDLTPLRASAAPLAAGMSQPPVPAGSVPARSPAGPDVPDHVVHAFLAAEDARFFEHGGIDPWSVGRATVRNLDGARQGGSTLTQQLAKRLILEDHPEPGLWRKVVEGALAIELERQLTKEEILRLYLSGVYLGAGARGVEEAARIYFDAPVDALTLAEAALLAGIPACPEACGPQSDPDGAQRRRAWVLDRMVARGWASPAGAEQAKRVPLP